MKKSQRISSNKNNIPEANTILLQINEAYRVLSRTALRREYYDRAIGVCGDNTYDETPL